MPATSQTHRLPFEILRCASPEDAWATLSQAASYKVVHLRQLPDGTRVPATDGDATVFALFAVKAISKEEVWLADFPHYLDAYNGFLHLAWATTVWQPQPTVSACLAKNVQTNVPA